MPQMRKGGVSISGGASAIELNLVFITCVIMDTLHKSHLTDLHNQGTTLAHVI